ncbi:uncharacterized protein ACLA_055400 [Aspergillus clavatus NRRL 1]|uniref:Tubby C-terminal-like domain-containing protein n=1 Tax=Aspergillus clavatus (strain ATCC 1007 / CBS 513.65 / DSM 816 / NCTC 3887 / NRRL 1 / QM 1276 / 107) TaxID=344612 RepID=A1C9G8_ASPCL|nr:uncharacterized protein ACLA_055400 [Aspergillus clavatus NRRL 1]EAW13492.1 conserved hypothetical protein [Aspergillus clavatus NRRL 1]
MSGSYAQARLNRVTSPKPRKTLRGPDRPIAIRSEYITAERAALILKPQGDAQSAAAYRIEDEEGQVQFTASGRKFSGRSCREFRDASGLPLFELHRKISLRNAWCITLPGSKITNMATGSPRLSFGAAAFGNFNISFRNAAAVESKREEDKEVTLEIERHGHVLESFDVVDGDRKVAEVRESIQHNKKLALMASSRRNYRPVLDVIVTPGVDVSLIAAIAVIASDSVFGSDD